MRDPILDTSEANASIELEAVLTYIEELGDAVSQRDHAAITVLLRRHLAMHLPREVREELATVAVQPPHGFRVAMAFLMYRHRMRQLAAGGEELPRAQLELGLTIGPTVDR
jgi:hypothetical protein